MSRKTVYTAVFAAAASGSIGAAISLASASAAGTQAYPVCVGVSTTGTVSGNHTVGPYCALNLPATQCIQPTLGASPQAVVTADVCLPN